MTGASVDDRSFRSQPSHPQTGSTPPAPPATPGQVDGHAGLLPIDLTAGLAGPRSVAWKINREVVLLLGWGRAILLQFAHPLVAAGVAEHSTFMTNRRARLRRLRQTLRAMLDLTFGTKAEVERAAGGINAIHDRVRGVLREPTGIFPAGTPYSAHDPALLAWVHATLLDTFPLTYELFVGPLTPEEKDRYCVEASGLEPLLGIPSGQLPRSTAELHRYLDEMLGSGQIAVGETARHLARELLHPPLPLWLQPLAAPLLWLARLPVIGTLPPPIREAYGLPWRPHEAAALRLMSIVLRRLLPLVPPVLRFWPKARHAARRGDPLSSEADAISAQAV